MFHNDNYYHLKDKDIIKRAASETGYYHKPAYYQVYIEREYHRKVSRSHIVKVLGTYKMRIQRLDYQIQLKAMELLDMAKNDINLLTSIIRRVYNDRRKTDRN